MADTSIEQPLFEIRDSVRISAAADTVYGIVTDLSRSGEWSEECRGGQWVSGTPGTVGAVFRGENSRGADVVGWAPVVRGNWTTDSEVIAAEPGRTFSWAIRNKAGQAQQSVWSFDVEPDGAECVLVHRFRMDAPTEGIRGITWDMDDPARQRFLREWAAKLRTDIAATLTRIKAVVEQG